MGMRRAWQRWLHHPQTSVLRRALFQIHLWVGLAMGLYIVMISLTGSAVVFRRELSRWLLPRDRDFSDGLPIAIRLMEWLVDLHDNLLTGSVGRTVNGVAAILVTLLVLTGAVLWWPGKGRWRRSLIVPRPSRTSRYLWHLHSALGIWGFVFLFGWAVTGIYFAFPEPFERLLNYFATDTQTFERPGEEILLTFIRLHFGRFGGLEIRILWVILGLLPAAMFVTGLIVWWKRTQTRSQR
jgi:uncharacterized iron-regulated membrane protein